MIKFSPCVFSETRIPLVKFPRSSLPAGRKLVFPMRIHLSAVGRASGAVVEVVVCLTFFGGVMVVLDLCT